MKRIIFLVVCGVLLNACSTTTNNNMIVNGNIKGLKKGTLYLQHIPDSTLVTVDSVVIDGSGNFELGAKIESPEVFYLYLDKKDNNELNDRITFFGEEGTISVTTTWDNFDYNAKIEGSATHEKLEEYQEIMSKFNKKNLEIISASYTPSIRDNEDALDSIRAVSDKNILRGYLFAINFAMNNKDSYIAPYIGVTEVADANVKLLDSIYNNLTPAIASSKYGKKLQTLIASKKAN